MFRKREKFDRTDVPRDSPYKNVIGAIVCVVVFAAVALAVYLVWNRVRLESRLGDADLSSAVKAQDEAVAPAGYVASSDELETTLLLTADSLEPAGAALQSARVLVVNKTQGTAALANIPLEAKVVRDSEPSTLAELFSSAGSAACVEPLASACGLSFDHVVVATGDVIEEAAALAGSGTTNLVRSASGLLSKMRTDLDAAGLLAMAESLSSVGTANLSQVDAVLVPETAQDADGNTVETGYQLVDTAQLGVALGTLVPAA